MNQYDQNRLTETPEIAPYYNDIPADVAERAYNNTSHFPERASSLVRADYAKMILQDIQAVEASIEQAKRRGCDFSQDPDEALTEWKARHRAGMRSRMMSYLHAHSSVASSFITGPARFPTARNEKRARSADNRYQELEEFRQKSIKGFLRHLLPYGDGSSIKTNDPKAVQKIDNKVSGLEATRDLMKAANKAFRKFYKKTERPSVDDGKYPACIAALVEAGLTELQAQKAIQPDFTGCCVPFKSYQLTNINSQIKRLASRTNEIEAVQATEINDTFPNGETARLDDGYIVVEFGYKPDEATRSALKSAAFKWSPRRVAWVRKATANAIAAYEARVKPLFA